MDTKTPFESLKSSTVGKRVRSFLSILPRVDTVAKRMLRATSKIPFIDDVLAMYYCATDSATPAKIKIAIVATLLYFVMPLDFIPDFLPLLGFGDDVSILMLLVKLVSDHVTDDHKANAKSKMEAMGLSPAVNNEVKEAA